MKSLGKRILFCVMLFALLPTPLLATPQREQQTNQATDNSSLWTAWNPTHYALAEDATALWIGAVGGVIRWDKGSGTYRRYTPIDGLPHHHVYAVAVDSAGNRWFGGDGGLSRLDANEVWSHITPDNSTLTHRLIDGIAVGVDGTLWVSHGATGGVSRRQVDGRWQWFPNRAAAVAADYTLILQTQNANRLWTVQGATVWVDYALYDGATWTDRTPPDGSDAVVDLVVDGAGVVWVLDKASIIRRWGGVDWTRFYRRDGQNERLAVDRQGRVWVTWRYLAGPPVGNAAGYGQLLDVSTDRTLQSGVRPTALLPTEQGVWVTGWGWLAQSDQSFYTFPDTPVYPDLKRAFLDRSGRIWLYSYYGYAGRYFAEGWLQTFQDQGTTALPDDQWAVRHKLQDLELMRQGEGADLWLVTSYTIRQPHQLRYLERWHNGAWLRYGRPLPPIVDLFVQDERRVWLAYQSGAGSTPSQQGILALDDQGTPLDDSDDQWIDYPITATGRARAVTVDTLGQLWYGDSEALYWHNGNAWQKLTVHFYLEAQQLLPAPAGTLLVIGDERVAVIGADHTQQVYDIKRFIHEQLPLLRSTKSSTIRWALARDGAVWYTDKPDAGPRQLRRYDGATEQSFALPAQLAQLTTPLVDANNHVWAVGDATLWRLSPTPAFQLQASPNSLLLARGQSQQAQITVMGQGGYSAPVSVQLGALPETLSATLAPATANPGEQMTVTLTSNAATATGDYSLTLIGNSGALTHTVVLTVTVVETLYGNYLPIVNR